MMTKAPRRRRKVEILSSKLYSMAIFVYNIYVVLYVYMLLFLPDPEDEEVDVEWEDADFEDRKDNDSVASTKRANDYDEQGCSRHDSNEDDGASLHSSKRLQKRCLGLSEQQEQLDAARLSMPFTMSININLDLDIGAPDSGAVTDNENTGNMILAHMVEELSRQLHISFLPMLKVWI